MFADSSTLRPSRAATFGSCRSPDGPTTSKTRTMEKLNPVTPGELLRHEFLEPMGFSQYRLAKEIARPPSESVRS